MTETQGNHQLALALCLFLDETQSSVHPHAHLSISTPFSSRPRIFAEETTILPRKKIVEVLLNPWARVKRQRLTAQQISMEIEPKLETDVDLENSPGSRPISDKELKESFARVTEIKSELESVKAEDQTMGIDESILGVHDPPLQLETTSVIQMPTCKSEITEIDLWNESVPMSDEELRQQIDLLANPIAKIKKDCQLTYESVATRLAAMKFPRYQIPLDEEYTTFMFRREYISHLYGGNTQAMLPDIAPDKIALHGVNDFMMITLDFNPHAPVNPGDPGLFYRVIKARKWSRCTARDLLAAEQNEEEEEKGKEHTPERLFVRICNNLWMYMGMYQLIPIDSLSTEEYCLQSPVNKREWTNQIMDKKGAKGIKARIALRSRLGREPTLSEMRKAVNDRALLDSVTPVQIESAYSKGEEEIGVWCMKCVGYDVEFQKLLVRNYSKWLNDPEVRNANKKLRAQTTRGPKTNAPKRTTKVAGQKRKRRGIGGKALVSDLDHSDSASDVEEIRYVPRSTRARPIIMPE